MDYQLGERLEARRQQEIRDVFQEQKSIATERLIEATMAVSIDATKVRQKPGESTTARGEATCEIGFRDAKIAAISEVAWDKKRQEAHCRQSSYVTGIEHADEFSQRIWVTSEL